MALPAMAPTDQRDQGLQLLRALTIACLVGAAGLLGVFGVLAATSIPGHSDAGSTAFGSSGNPSDWNTSGSGQLQGPDQGAFGPGAGTPIVVSGGSK